MKKKPTWFKLYPADFLADRDVERMALDEFGLYCYLLMRGWMDGGIPASLDEIGRYTMLRGTPRNKLERMWRAVGPCWAPASGTPDAPLVNRRQEIERQNVSDYWGAKSRAGKASAAKRQKQKDDAPTHVEHVFNTPSNNLDQDIRQHTEEFPPTPLATKKPPEPGSDDWAESVYARWKKYRDRILALQALSQITISHEAFEATYTLWCRYHEAKGWNFAPTLAVFLTDRTYLQTPPALAPKESADDVACYLEDFAGIEGPHGEPNWNDEKQRRHDETCTTCRNGTTK